MSSLIQNDSINCYGDKSILMKNGYGIDIASQRLDDLDKVILSNIDELILKKNKNDINILEIGSGYGGLTREIILKGVNVFAIDCCDYRSSIDKFEKMSQSQIVNFYQAVMPNIPKELNFYNFDFIVSQRTLHYLKYSEVKKLLSWCSQNQNKNGLIYISVSGMSSELSIGYRASNKLVESRWDFLNNSVSILHNLHHKICLYKMPELIAMMEMFNYAIIKDWASDFGNLKLIGVLNEK